VIIQTPVNPPLERSLEQSGRDIVFIDGVAVGPGYVDENRRWIDVQDDPIKIHIIGRKLFQADLKRSVFKVPVRYILQVLEVGRLSEDIRAYAI
jgi:hypothetical protein